MGVEGDENQTLNPKHLRTFATAMASTREMSGRVLFLRCLLSSDSHLPTNSSRNASFVSFSCVTIGTVGITPNLDDSVHASPNPKPQTTNPRTQQRASYGQTPP